MNILDLAKKISSKLNINYKYLEDIITKKLNNVELNNKINDNKLKHFEQLFSADDELNNFNKNLNVNTRIQFDKLKENLGKLQILVIMKNLEQSQNCDDIINSLLSVFNNKIQSVNNILDKNFIQTGGEIQTIKSLNKQFNNIYFYKKYLKYKIKYLIKKY